MKRCRDCSKGASAGCGPGIGLPDFQAGRFLEDIEQYLGAPDAGALGLADFPHDVGGFELANGPDFRLSSSQDPHERYESYFPARKQAA